MDVISESRRPRAPTEPVERKNPCARLLSRLSFGPGPYSLRPVTTDTTKKAHAPRFDPLTGENIEALAMAIIMAVILEYFIVEA